MRVKAAVMRRLRVWLKRFAGFVNKPRDERDLAEEIEAGLQLQIEHNMQSGMRPDEARRVARLRFGSIEAAKEAVRDRRTVPFIETLARDVKFALRMMGQNKGWTTVAILSLTLGIGVNTALFSIVNDVLLQKLAVERPDDLIAFRWAGENDMTNGLTSYGYTPADPQTGLADPRHTGAGFSFEVFRQFKEEAAGLAGIFSFVPIFNLSVIAEGQAEFTTGQYVSGDFFTALGVSAAYGRTIDTGDEDPAAEPVVVISHQYWQRRFAMDTSVIGEKVILNKMPFTIVGITPEHLGSLTRSAVPAPDITLPLAMEPRLAKLSGGGSRLERPAYWWVLVMGRLKPGSSGPQVAAKLESGFETAIREEWSRALSTMNPERRASPEISGANKVPRLQVIPGSQGIFDATPQQSGPLTILGVIVAILLLIVCTNVANLLLSRGVTRQKEITIRSAIGATRPRLIAQMLIESLVIAGLGGASSSLVAYWCRTSLPQLLGFRPVDMDWRVMSFALAVTFATGILFGLVPALRTTRADAPLIRESGSQATGLRSRLGKSLLVVQVALSLVLMIGAGLFLRTLNNLRSMDVGFNPSNIVLFRILPALAQYNDARLIALDDEILDRLAAIPGVRSASFSSIPILSNEVNMATFSIDGSSRHARTHALEIHRSYFETMGLPLRLGRGFTREDNPSSPAVVIVNEAFAKEVFPNENPLGRRIQQTFAGAPVAEIVGVVADAKYADIRDPAPSTFYIHDLQRPTGIRTFAVRTVGDATTLIPAVREVVRSIDPLLPLQMVRTQTDAIERSIAEERVLAMTTSLFGALALVISIIGLFGLMSYAVTRRTREIGIRMALGADSRSLLRSVMYETTALVALGIVIGLAASLALTRMVASRLYGLAPHDPATILIAVLLMLAVAWLAAYLPARRAAQINPLTALRLMS